MGLTTWSRRRSVAVVMVAAMAAVATGCGSDTSDQASSNPGTSPSNLSSASPSPTESASTSTPSKAKSPASAASPVTVPAVLDFSATTASGDAFNGSSVAGKPVVLWFWAPWCAVCRSQAPQVEKLAAQYGEDLAVIGVGSLDSGSAISRFANDVPGPLHLSDPNGDLWKRFKISEQSSFVVLDAGGAEVLRTGYNDDDALNDAVQKVVG